MKKVVAEMLGTFALVFVGCGSSVLAASFPNVGIGFLGVSLAFGLTFVAMAYAIGPVSGAHMNPAVTLGLAVARRFPFADVAKYVMAQLAGAVLAATVLYVIANGRPAFDVHEGFSSNGYGLQSPGGYGMMACFVVELVLSFVLLFVFLAATDERAPKGFAPLAIGLALTAGHLVGMPVTGASMNPARSTGPALFAGGWAIAELWLFWAAPAAGAVFAGFVYPWLSARDGETK